MPGTRGSEHGFDTPAEGSGARRAPLKRIKATFLDHTLWTKFNLKLLWENKSLQDWVNEQISELNRQSLSSLQPVRESERVRVSPSELERKHWVPVRVDPSEYRKARWRWSALGVTMTEWFYKRILDYCGDVDLDTIEKALTARESQTAEKEQAQAAPAAGPAEGTAKRPRSRRPRRSARA